MSLVLTTFLHEMRTLSLRWNDYLVLAVSMIFKASLENTMFNIQSIDTIVNYLLAAEEESTLCCCIKGKSLSRLLLHQFLVYVFVSSDDGKTNLEYDLFLSLS